VPAITLQGDADGAPRPDPSSYAKKFSGKYSHRTIKGGIGHNLPQEAPQAFAKAVVDVDGYWSALACVGSADFRYEVTEDNERAEQPEDTTANALFLAAMRLEMYKRKPPRITKKETPMRYRLLGNSGLRVSEAALVRWPSAMIGAGAQTMGWLKKSLESFQQ